MGFGDAGKGLLTDYFVRKTGAGLVVRFNGGAQAGHNVVTPDGRHHTFAQFGAGSFVSGTKTYLSEHVLVHPSGLLREAEEFPLSLVRMSDRARIITPYHQEAGREREKRLHHGSCGIGVGETVKDSLEFPNDTIYAADFRDPSVLREKLTRVRDRKAVLLDLDMSPWIEACESLADHVGPFVQEETIVFEGAQGVLLDENYGFHPHTTWSTCTPKNALELIPPKSEVRRVGVLRTHMVRHGIGPLPTETDAFRDAISDHNHENEWQGRVRYGWFDADLARYALQVSGDVDQLAITHVDALARMPVWKARVDSQYVELAPREEVVLPAIERLLGRRIDLISRGPCSLDVAER